MKSINQFKRAMTVGSMWDVRIMWNNGQIWLPTKEIISGECVRVSNNRFTINNGVEDLNVDFQTKQNFIHRERIKSKFLPLESRSSN